MYIQRRVVCMPVDSQLIYQSRSLNHGNYTVSQIIDFMMNKKKTIMEYFTVTNIWEQFCNNEYDLCVMELTLRKMLC